MGESIPSPGPYSPVSISSLTGHHPLQSPALSYTSSVVDGEEQDSVLLLERRSFRPFKSSEDYLYAMREDLAEWLNGLYSLSISVDDFFERLENGVLLCEHANNVRKSAEEHLVTNGKKLSTKYEIPPYEVYFRKDSAPGSFFARDNIHNFIRWCRDLGVHDVLMFETDDLVLRKNEKHVILALLEIARRGARFGMAAPLLVQMEADIDREIEKDRLAMENQNMADSDSMVTSWVDDVAKEEPEEPPNLIYGPQPQVVTNDLKSLDDMVRDLVEHCTCPSQFPMIKVSEGKYRIGDTKVLIFVRILRKHVMVRVGGGWDTLHHYLDKHDPCRCRSGHRSTIASKLGFKTSNAGDRDLKSVSYKRTDEGFTPSSPAMARRKSTGFRREGSEPRTNLRNRSQSPALRDNPNLTGSPRFTPKFVTVKDESGANGVDMWCDSSSEVSDEGYKSQGPPRASLRARRLSPKKGNVSDMIERPDSSMTHLSSEGSSVSTDDSGVVASPPRSPPTGITRPWLPTGTKIPRSSLATPKGKLSLAEKSSYVDSLLAANKKQKSKSVSDTSRRMWNAGPGIKDTTPRSRRSSVSDSMDGRTISRSRSATSEGGFQSMLRKDSAGRQSLRSLTRKTAEVAGKNTWNGRSRNYPSMNQESFRPPIGTRSVRSASASPATVRRTFGSAPSTPLNLSPKRSAPTTTLHSPEHDYLPAKVEYCPEGENADLLAHIEDLVNDYRTKVYNMFLMEGKPMPPELSEGSTPPPPPPPEPKGIKPTPRKSGLGSRIPAPVF